MRHPKSWIAEREPGWRFAKGFSEEDKLWKADYRETNPERDVRVRNALVWIVDNDDSTCKSLHSRTSFT